MEDIKKTQKQVKRQRKDLLREKIKHTRKKWKDLPKSQIIKHNCQRRLRRYLFKGVFTKKSESIFGLNIKEYRKYLELKFKDGMTWENYGKVWCIDHIKPYSCFNLENEKELCKCFNYKNTQPLFISENCSKLNKTGKMINIFSTDIRKKFNEQGFTQKQIDFIAYYLPALYTIKKIKESLKLQWK